MSVSEQLWLASTALTLLSTIVLIGLVAFRAVSDRRARTRRSGRRRHVALMLADEPAPQDGRRGAVAGDALTDVAVGLLRLVRGEEKERLVARAARLGVAERLRRRLRRGDVRVRILAAEALCHFGDAASTASLDRALDDRNPDVRLTAALSLAAGGRAPPAGALVRRLGIGTDVHSLLAITLLTDLARTDLGEVRALLRDPGAPAEVKAAAADALAACDDFAIVPELAALAIAADPEAPELVRYLDALATLEHPAAAPAVIHGLGSPAPAVRARAARAAGRIALAAAAPRLAGLLGDPDWWVRFRAGRALVRLGADGEALLRRAAAEGKAPARQTAALTLAEHEAGA